MQVRLPRLPNDKALPSSTKVYGFKICLLHTVNNETLEGVNLCTYWQLTAGRNSRRHTCNWGCPHPVVQQQGYWNCSKYSTVTISTRSPINSLDATSVCFDYNLNLLGILLVETRTIQTHWFYWAWVCTRCYGAQVISELHRSTCVN